MGVRSAGFFPRIDTSAIARRGAEYTLLIVFALCFVGGAAAGALAGSGAIPDGEAILTDDGNIYGSDSFFQLLLSWPDPVDKRNEFRRMQHLIVYPVFHLSIPFPISINPERYPQ